MSVEAEVGWRDRQVSAAEAVSVVRPGDKVFVGSACATPRTLVVAVEQLKRPGVLLVQFLTDRVGTGDPPHTNRRPGRAVGARTHRCRQLLLAQPHERPGRGRLQGGSGLVGRRPRVWVGARARANI